MRIVRPRSLRALPFAALAALPASLSGQTAGQYPIAESADRYTYTVTPSFSNNPLPARGGVVSITWKLENQTGRYVPHEAINPLFVPASIKEQNADLPASLRGRIVYDPATQFLLFNGTMTAAERTALLALFGNSSYRATIQLLYDRSQTVTYDRHTWIPGTGYFLALKLPADPFATSPTPLPSWLTPTLDDDRHLAPPNPELDDNHVRASKAWYTLTAAPNPGATRSWTGVFVTNLALDKDEATAKQFYDDPQDARTFTVTQLGLLSTPEPGTLALAASGLAVVGGMLRRRRR